jgi:flavin reductase (DIM6/NTAB) family NADH-FMN oxidoreductase RutF
MTRDSKGSALECLTYGIHFVTTKSGEIVAGFTATWVSQVSFDPPHLMLSVRQDSYAHKIIKDGGVFAVNLLSEKQAETARRHTRSVSEEGEAFSSLPSQPKKTGAPILKDALAYIECQVVSALDAGDHTIFLGEVVASGVLAQGKPLTTANSNLFYSPGES